MSAIFLARPNKVSKMPIAEPVVNKLAAEHRDSTGLMKSQSSAGSQN